MKKVLLTLFVVLLVLGLFAAVGYTGYRFGYAQGVQSPANEELAHPGLRLFDGFERRAMPFTNFGDRFDRDFGSGGFLPRGFGFFSPFRLLVQIAVISLILLFVYWLIMRSGWHLMRTPQPVEAQPKPIETEVKEPDQTV